MLHPVVYILYDHIGNTRFAPFATKINNSFGGADVYLPHVLKIVPFSITNHHRYITEHGHLFHIADICMLNTAMLASFGIPIINKAEYTLQAVY